MSLGSMSVYPLPARGEEVGKDGPIQLHEEFNEVIHDMHVLEYSYSIPVDRKKGTSHRHRLR
jgi:hypothetical protein